MNKIDLLGNLIAWLEADGYSHKEAKEDIYNAEIIDFSTDDKEIYKVTYVNGKFDVIEVINDEIVLSSF